MLRLLLCSLLLVFVSGTQAQSTRYRLLDNYYCKEKMLNSSIPNTLKMYDCAVDQKRGLAYVAGIVTRTTSVIDLNTKRETGAVTTTRSAGQLIGLGVVPGNGYLIQAFTEMRPVTIDLLNPANSQVAGTYTFSSSTSVLSGMSVDPSSGRIFLGDSVFVRILDGNNLTLLTSINNGVQVGEPQIDTVNRRLYVAAKNPQAGNVTVKVYSADAPYTLQRSFSVPSTTPLGRMFFDLTNNRMICASFSSVKTVDLTSGAVGRSVSVFSSMNDLDYVPSLQKVYGLVPDSYTDNGLHGSWCKFYAISISTGAVDSFMMGDKSSRIEYYAAGNKLVFPEMHSGFVSLFDPATQQRDSVDIGESADYFSFSPDRKDIYIIKRLGGSKVLKFNKDTKALTEFKAGAWPSTCETDSALNKLFVVNHFESSVSVFNTITGALITTIPFSTDEGRTDAILSSYLDTKLHKLIVCMPEYKKMFIVDCNTYAVTQTVVPGFEYASTDKGIGVLQAISDPRSGKVFCLSFRNRKVKVHNINSNAWTDTITFGTLWNTALTTMQANCLLLDTLSNKLFVGNIPVNLSTLRAEAVIPGIGSLLGFNKQRSLLYGIGTENDTVYVYELNPSTYAVQLKVPLYKSSDFYTVVYKYDELNNELYTAEFNTALVRRYKLEPATGIEPGSNANVVNGYRLEQNYPNPFNPATVIGFTVPEAGDVSITVYDILGSKVSTLINERKEPGYYSAQFTCAGLNSGTYFCVLKANGKTMIKKMQLIK